MRHSMASFLGKKKGPAPAVRTACDPPEQGLYRISPDGW